MIEERSLVIKPPGESKIGRPCRGTGGEGGGGRNTHNERHISNFVDMKVSKLFFYPKIMFRHVSSRALGSYTPSDYYNNA